LNCGRPADFGASRYGKRKDETASVGFVLRGRLKCVRVDARGHETLFRMIERGQQFGLMIGALSEPVPVRVIALEPTTILSLDYEKAMELTFQYPELRRLWLTTFAGNLRKLFFDAAPRRAPMVLALIHDSAATRPSAERLVNRLCDIGEKIQNRARNRRRHRTYIGGNMLTHRECNRAIDFADIAVLSG
jgi:CRP-like cAMP-binding protein